MLKITTTALVFLAAASAFLRTVEATRQDDEDFDFKGIVQMLPVTANLIGDWKVGGRTVHVSASTRIDQEERPVAVGVSVEVEGSLRSDGSVDATKIQVEDDQSETEFKGIIESFPSGLIGDWMIGGRTVIVTAMTHIDQEDGTVTVGAFAEVEGFSRPDGSVDASQIEIQSDQNEFEFKGVIEHFPAGFVGDWVISGRTVHVAAATHIDQEDGRVAMGATVEVEGTLRPDGSIDARKIEVKSTGHSREIFKGTVDHLPASGTIGDWEVSGRAVHVSASTRIKQKHSSISVGTIVMVKGITLSDGSIQAQMIKVKKSQ
jgi:hypothetical protein